MRIENAWIAALNDTTGHVAIVLDGLAINFSQLTIKQTWSIQILGTDHKICNIQLIVWNHDYIKSVY